MKMGIWAMGTATGRYQKLFAYVKGNIVTDCLLEYRSKK